MREAIDTHNKRLKHDGLKPTTLRSSPDISIKASGPSFTFRTSASEVGYSNMAAFADIKRQKEVNNDNGHVVQVGVYAR
jgi:hypothetical protein